MDRQTDREGGLDRQQREGRINRGVGDHLGPTEQFDGSLWKPDKRRRLKEKFK